MRATIREIAEAAGVSAMAVSAVLNGTGSNVKVSEDKANLIRRVARELHYQPNHLARSLRNRRTNMIGVVFQHLDRIGEEQPYYPQLLNGVLAALFPAEYTLALCPKLIMDGDAGTISDGRFDGVLWCRPDFSQASLELIRNASVPIVFMHAPPASVPGLSTFCADNEAALKMVVSYLCELGHQRMAFVVDPVNEHTAEGRDRIDAFQRACFSRALVPDVLVWDEACPGLQRYREAEAPHTALVCFSDTLAGSVLKACHKYEVSVPHHVSVVGFDSTVFCEGTRPRLTSVRQPVEQMAFVATSYLLDRIKESLSGESAPPPISRIYQCVLDIRDSTAAPRFLSDNSN